jgi:LuxR family transcriptional regulator, positive regulator of biofilm formation
MKRIKKKDKIYIFGPLKLQNELLVSYLEKNTGMDCKYWRKQKITSIPDRKDVRSSLILLDCYDNDMDSFWIKLDLSFCSTRHKCYVALINVNLKKGIEKEAVKRNVRGIFYNDDPPEILAKGVKAILKGELWFSRMVLKEILFDEIRYNEKARNTNSALTPREKEILIMLASGEANEEIADHLCISPHTVKTHVYNIYNKIAVPNRIQAALWASQNLIKSFKN